MMPENVQNTDQQLFADIRQMIEQTRFAVSQTVNAGLTLLFWNIGKRINEEILGNQRAEYGKRIVVTLSRQLTIEYGKTFEEKNLRRMMQFSEKFADFEIVVSLMRQLVLLKQKLHQFTRSSKQLLEHRTERHD